MESWEAEQSVLKRSRAERRIIKQSGAVCLEAEQRIMKRSGGE